MQITEANLRKIIRKAILESAFESPYPDAKITSIAGMDMYGDHRTFFDKVKQAEVEDPGTIDLFIDWAYQAESSTLPEWIAQSQEAKWVGMNEIQWENVWHYVEELGAEPFIKKLMG